MCGIAGIFTYEDHALPVERDELLEIRDSMVNRGPDGAGIWIDPGRRIGLAHRRLAIIDLSERGAQPMVSTNRAYVITFNGEIYNFRDLKRDLEQRGHRFYSTSDTEVLLALYEHFGIAMVDHLRGMFAFAIWDSKIQQLFLARDPFGIKPLYYSDDGRTLRFASQVKALLSGGAIDTAPEPAGLTGFLLLGSVPEPHTIYRSVRCLEAGAMLTIRPEGAGP